MSQMESFDPKPELNKWAGKTFEESPYKHTLDSPYLKKNLRELVEGLHKVHPKLYELQVGYKKYGQSGLEIADWWAQTAQHADDLAIVRSMWTTDDNHGAQVQFHSGRHMLDPRVPTIGAWVNYGLGTLNENLPQFINMGPRFFDPRDGHYLGPAYDAVKLKVDPKNPLDYAKPEGTFPAEEQKLGFDLVNRLNRLIS
jgi:hypothetical protein